MRNTGWSLGLVVLVAALGLLPSLAFAESENVFLLFGGSEKEQKALEAEANYFRSAMLKHANYVFVADQERMVVMAQCREEMGVSLDEERACQLRATKRLMAQRVFELRARQQKGRVELTLTVLNDDGGTIYETIMEYEGDELSTAARRLFPSLALAYLCDSEKVTSACSGSGDAVSGGTGANVSTVTVDKGESIVNELVDDTGFIVVKSEPSGARVSLNGKEVGKTPWQDELMLGKYVVVVESGGLYHPGREELLLTSKGAKLDFSLSPRFGTLSVTSEPSGAKVYVNDELVGSSPWEHTQRLAGSYVIRVTQEGYLDAEQTVQVEEGKKASFKAKLETNVGTLVVKSEPSGASVSLDGRSLGTTPLQSKLQPGTYTVKLELAGYGDVVEKVKLERNQQSTVSSTMPAKLGLVSVLSSLEDGTPCEGEVYVDGQKVGEQTPTKLELTALRHTVKVECAEGSAEQVVEVEHNGKQKLELVVVLSTISTKWGFETWMDASSGLEWQVEPTGGEMTWKEAKKHCEGLGKGWRLPDLSELRSLIRGCSKTEVGGSCGVTSKCLSYSKCRNDACGGCDFKIGKCYWPGELAGDCGWYWSSSPYEDNDDDAWPVDFGYGRVYYVVDVDFVKRVRCVR